jgi:hypothetical protein
MKVEKLIAPVTTRYGITAWYPSGIFNLLIAEN